MSNFYFSKVNSLDITKKGMSFEKLRQKDFISFIARKKEKRISLIRRHTAI
jgi:hypothetical protein